MPAYVVADIEVTDPVRYEEYKRLAAASVAKYGGRYVARGGKSETLEGTWRPSRLVILEFPTAARAREWYDSPEYGPARTIRHETATTDAVIVEGVSG